MSVSVMPVVRLEERNAVSVLLVSSNSRLKNDMRERLRFTRWNLSEVDTGSEALERLQQGECKVVLLDPILPDLLLEDFRALARDEFPEVQVISVNPDTGMLVLGTTSPTAVAAQLTEDVRSERISAPALAPAGLSALRRPSPEGFGIRNMVGNSAAMQRVYKLVRMVARRNTTVLVIGESGTGKELVATAIHSLSDRQKQPLVAINCAAIPESLLEAELFGYTKGSFTGAVQSRVGRIHAAHGGTLFLDEIGEMPLPLQSKILRFLEQGEVQRIGGNDNLKVDVRVVAASNADLQSLVKQRLFREDLYHRLNIFPVNLPPLRDRHGDIRVLAEFFLRKFGPDAILSNAAIAIMERHDWRGNVRELRNVIERACILADGSCDILPEHISL